MRKGTKLTENPKDYMLRVRMDKSTVDKLDTVCEKEKKSRSEVVREGIEQKYQQIKK
jgi:metal-responsive CopG/Arc/MetJ family transcriptional regulator